MRRRSSLRVCLDSQRQEAVVHLSSSTVYRNATSRVDAMCCCFQRCILAVKLTSKQRQLSTVLKGIYKKPFCSIILWFPAVKGRQTVAFRPSSCAPWSQTRCVEETKWLLANVRQLPLKSIEALSVDLIIVQSLEYRYHWEQGPVVSCRRSFGLDHLCNLIPSASLYPLRSCPSRPGSQDHR